MMTATDCSSSSIQGSSTSSASSDVMTLTTTAASSWCALSASTRLRVIRLVRPHQRRLLVMPDGSPSYGFAVRGGKEFGTGFFVSHVERNSEAELKGLRVGDQIVRINGFRVDDAVHKEFIQLVTSQDRLILKVRSVGMLPIKEKVEDRLAWNVVKVHSISNTPSESSYKTITCNSSSSNCYSDHAARTSKDINVVLNVAPRTKLGLGICKGPEWKPGIFVQFTKEKSVAREAGLRPGDQILSVNSIDFADVLFSEAVAVMKSSTKLDMIVRTAAGCDLFPGESSGYNSSASSVTGDQSPCWADIKSKRLTAVREEPTASNANNWQEMHYAGAITQQRQCKANAECRELNKTIIKLSENGTSINNTFIANGSMGTVAAAVANVAPPPPPPLHNLHLNEIDKSNVVVGVKVERNVSNNSESYATSSKVNNCGSNLSSAINEELKKRKEKQQQLQQCNSKTAHMNHIDPQQQQQQQQQHRRLPPQQHLIQFGNRNSNSNNSTNSNTMLRQISKQSVATNNGMCSVVADVAATNGSERHSSHSNHNRNNNSHSNINNAGDQHSALMDEFKRAHQRIFKNGFQETEHKEREETLNRTTLMADDAYYRNNREELLKASNGNAQMPPPPPQFANSPLPERAPNSPLPDYQVELRDCNTLSKNNAANRRATVRLGAVIIGEYEQQQQSDVTQENFSKREPAKFDFIQATRRGVANNSNNDSSSNSNNSPSENLRNELQSTLSRAKLRKTTANEQMEHQNHCVLQHRDYKNYEYRTAAEVDNLTLKLQSTSFDAAANAGKRLSIGTCTGILKNGNQRSNSANVGSNNINGSNGVPVLHKYVEKSIKFGN